jgi:hypothetical protein
MIEEICREVQQRRLKYSPTSNLSNQIIWLSFSDGARENGGPVGQLLSLVASR